MTADEIKLSAGDIAERDRIVLERRPMSEEEIFGTAGEAMQSERAHVVGIIQDQISHLQGLPFGAVGPGRGTTIEQLENAISQILAGRQEGDNAKPD